MKKIEIKVIKEKFEEFIKGYQNSLWASNFAKLDKPVALITLQDLLYKLEFHISLNDFKELIKQDEETEIMIKEFINNNFIHYAASVKMKELLQEYKESNILIEPETFELDYSKIDTFAGIGVKLDKRVSLNCDLDSDIEGKVKDKVLENVEKFE